MSKKPETVFAEKVDRDLRDIFGLNIWVENIQQVTKNGTPDRLICLNGYFVALEFKIEGGNPDQLQLRKLLEIKKAGGKAYVVYPSTWPIILKKLILLNKQGNNHSLNH